MDKIAEIAVGDKLLAVPYDSRRGKPFWVEVSKIGRKWAALKSEHGYDWGRCDKRSLVVDGGAYTPSHRLYRSEQEYAEKVERDRLWRLVRNATQAPAAPERLTMKTLREICQHLNGE